MKMKMKMMMKFQICLALLLITFSCVTFALRANERHQREGFFSCLLEKNSNDNTISAIIHTPKNASFKSVLDVYIQNTKYLSPETPKPVAILTPETESHIQTAIYCGKKYGLEMRIRSGGHDFEGNSYISRVPFFILDMFNFRSVSVDVESKTAWLGSGAMLGEVYYGIYEKSSTLAFPGGYCPTVGVGGLISGGGYGALTREFGLAADAVVDARVIDASGRILDRESMSEDFFWAIRGGIGSNFAVILSYKVKLVEVPEYVIGFNIPRTIEQNAVKLVHKWQHIVTKLPLELTLSLAVFSSVSPQTGKPTALAIFAGVYRGGVDEFLSIMEEKFPELGATGEDCHRIRWIQYFPFHMAQPYENPKEFFTSRVPPFVYAFSGKSDFLTEPIPEEGVEKILNKVSELPPFSAQMEWTCFGGGIMEKIPESETPFPHRKASVMLFEMANWTPNPDGTSDVAEARRKWVKELHDIVGEYVQKNPRAAYPNYRDYDLGINNVNGETSIEQAKKWGIPYFKDNFDRLVKVKNMVDPENFFRNEQSFPVFPVHSEL